MNSRRTFLKQVYGATLALGTASALRSWAIGSGQSDSIAIPGEDGMIVRSARFFDLETPVEYFDQWLTPVAHFFVRNHMHEPGELTAEGWRLSIGGEVEKPLTLALADVGKLQSNSVVNTLECAGNGRSLHRPQVPGIQWAKVPWVLRNFPAHDYAMFCRRLE
jgi:DMSO/TMAO reductase YedYZ molybdopterin-dependent catalytic subunit